MDRHLTSNDEEDGMLGTETIEELTMESRTTQPQQSELHPDDAVNISRVRLECAFCETQSMERGSWETQEYDLGKWTVYPYQCMDTERTAKCTTIEVHVFRGKKKEGDSSQAQVSAVQAEHHSESDNTVKPESNSPGRTDRVSPPPPPPDKQTELHPDDGIKLSLVRLKERLSESSEFLGESSRTSWLLRARKTPGPTAKTAFTAYSYERQASGGNRKLVTLYVPQTRE